MQARGGLEHYGKGVKDLKRKCGDFEFRTRFLNPNNKNDVTREHSDYLHTVEPLARTELSSWTSAQISAMQKAHAEELKSKQQARNQKAIDEQALGDGWQLRTITSRTQPVPSSSKHPWLFNVVL